MRAYLCLIHPNKYNYVIINMNKLLFNSGSLCIDGVQF